MSGNSLQALSSSVKSATDPVLLQQALAAFATKTPDLNAFLKKGEQYCSAFRTKFPEKAVVQEKKVGAVQAAWKTASFLFHALTTPLDEFPEEAPEFMELFSSMIDEGRTKLSQINSNLDHLENLLSRSSQENTEKVSQEIRDLREQRIILESCLPQLNQGKEATKVWSDNIDKHLKASNNLVETFQRAATEKLAKNGQTKAAQELRAMVETKLPGPMKETVFSAFIADEIGDNTNIALPTFSQFTSFLKPLAFGSKNPVLIQAVNDVEKFESFLAPFREKMAKYPFERFIKDGIEYNEILEPVVKQFQDELKARLNALDAKKTSAVFVPITSAKMSIDRSLNFDINSFSLFQSEYSLFRIEKSGNNYNIRMYNSAPEGEKPFTPHRTFTGVSRKQLLNHAFIKELLQYSTHISEAQELRDLSPLIENKWSESTKVCSWYRSGINCYLSRIATTIGDTVAERAQDFARATEAMVGLQSALRTKFTGFLSTHLGALTIPETAISFSGKKANNPWGVWEALLLDENKKDILFDLKLSGLVALSHTQKDTDEDTEILLNLGKAALVSLNRELSDDTSIPTEKLLFAHSVLEEVKERLSARERNLQISLASKIKPVETDPLFASPSKQIELPRVESVTTNAPNVISKMELIGDLRNWNPLEADLEPLYSFAGALDESYKKENYDGIIVSTKAFFERFNLARLDSDFWDSLDSSDAEKIFLSLEKISEFYFKSYFDANVPKLPDAESTLLMMETMGLADQLMKKLPESHELHDKNMPLSEISAYLFNRGTFFKFGDPKLDERLQALQAHCQASMDKGVSSLFSTNMAPLPQQHPTLGLLYGDLASTPRIFMFGNGAWTTPDGHRIPESWRLESENHLEGYINKFMDQYDQKAPLLKNYLGMLKVEKMKNMLTGEVDNVLPPTFYAARKMAHHAEFFFRGTFVKPPGFRKTKSSYDLNFNAISAFEPIPGMGFMVGSIMSLKAWVLNAKIEGIDSSVFHENKDLPDGISSAHQFYHLQRPVIDPVIKGIQAPLLKQAGNAMHDAFFSSGWNPYSSFAPGITEAGRALQDLNVVMIQQTQDLKKYLTKQKFEQIASLRTEPAIQVANTLSFFRQNSILLKNPDMQSYFNQLIFDQPLLLNELQLPNRGPELEKQLAEFASEEYSLNKGLGNRESADFYLGLISRLRQYCLFSRKQYPAIYAGKPIPQIFEIFPSILDKAINLADDTSKGVLHGLAAQQWMSEDSLSFEDGEKFLRHVLLYNQFPASGKTIDPLLSANIKSLVSRFTPNIAQLKLGQNFFDSLVRDAYPQLPQNAEFIASAHNPLVFSVKDHPVTIDLSQGIVMAPGIEGIPLPADGLNSPIYTSLYGAREFRCKAISNSVFEFKDMHGQVNRLIRRLDGEFVLHRKFPSRSKGWYQYIPQDQLLPGQKDKSQSALPQELIDATQKVGMEIPGFSYNKPLPILPAMPLIEGHSHWHTESTPAEMLIVDKLGRVAYRAEIDSPQIVKTSSSPKILKKIHRVSAEGKDQLELIDSTTPSFSWALQFENPEQILIWKNPQTQQPERIEFPRFGLEGLSFTKDGNTFKSDQFSGYSLKRNQINPFGINCPNFLILQNKKGEEKLILAGQAITQSKKSSLSSRLSFERNSQKVGTRVPFYVYDKVSGDKTFGSQEIVANFYLATIYAAQNQYKDAISLLRQFGQGSNPFTVEEQVALSWIKDLNNKLHNDSPQLTAVRALAHITESRNKKEHTNEQQKKELTEQERTEQQKLKEVAKQYFAGAEKLGLFRLNPEEEFFLIEHGLMGDNKNPLLDQALKTVSQQMSTDLDKAKDMLLVLGKEDILGYAQIFGILNRPNKSFSKTASTTSFLLEPILKDPLDFVEKLATPSDGKIQESLKALFGVEGVSEIERKGLDFYHKDSVAYLEKKDKSEYRLKDKTTFKAKRIELEQTYIGVKESLVQAELSILRLVAKASKDPVVQARTASQAQGNVVAPMEMNDIILLFMKKDLNVLKSINPELSDKDILEIDGLIDLYLDLSIQNSQRKRVVGKMLDIEQLGSLKEDDATLKLALQSFVAESTTKRHFDPSKNRFLKVFEYHNGFYYRENQISKLQNLGVQLEGSEANLLESLVLEMMVGAGKTTYLLPTKGFWSADGTKLSMAIMPEALIGNMSREVERILGKSFAQKVRRFLFSRNTDLSAANLESILKMLQNAIEKKEYLITTDKSLKAFINQYAKVFKEALTAKEVFLSTHPEIDRKNLPADIKEQLMALPEVVTAKLMSNILKVFKEKADVLCDEADLILDPRRELNFPAGEASPLPENYLGLSLQVYKFLISPEIQQITSFEFYPTGSDKDSCTPKVYEEKVKPALVKQITDFLSQKGTDTSFKDLKKFYGKCNNEEKEMLKSYLLGSDPEHKAENWIRELSDDNIRQELGLLRGQLNVLLPLTLQKNYGERYGFHTEESIVADPFSGSNNPNFGSQFSDPFERIDYTIQAYLKEPGMRRPVIEKLVHDLQGRAWAEMTENLEEIKKLPANAEYKTKAHKEFEQYFGNRKNLGLFQKDLVERLMEILKEEPKTKFDLIEKYVLPQVKIYTQNLKSTSQSIGFLFSNPKGFTGTLWNKGTYHDAFKALFDDGARGQVVTLAYTQAKDKVTTIKIKDSTRLHKELIIGNPKYSHIKALIDAGGSLKEFDLETVAQEWLDSLIKQKSPIQGVVYFDMKTDQAYIWEKGESAPIPLTKSSCPPDKRITIYDQKHTTGTDIKQAIDAVALVTVSKGMIIRDFIQAVGRMRQLASGQKIEIAVLEQDAVAIREQLKLDPKAELTIDDVLRFLILNEVRRQGEDNQVATSHKLPGVLQEWFIGKVLAASDFSQVMQDFTHPELIEGLFFQTSEIAPFKSYGQGTDLIEAKAAYQGKQESLISRLNLESIFKTDRFLGNAMDTVRGLMSAVISKADLPSLVSGSLHSADTEEQQEVQQQQETQQEQQQQQEEMQDKSAGHKPWRHSQWPFLNENTVEKAKIYEVTAGSTGRKDRWGDPIDEDVTYAHFLSANDVVESKIFSEDFELSHNFQLNGRVYQGEPVKPFGEFQKPIQNILIVQNKKTKKFKLIAIEPNDAVSFKTALQKRQGIQPIQKDPDLEKLGKSGWWNSAKDYFSYKNDWGCLDGKEETDRRDWRSSRCDSDNPGQVYERGYWDENDNYHPGGYKTSDDRAYQSGDDVKVWIGDLQLNSLFESRDAIARSALESDDLTKLLIQAEYFNGIVHYSGRKRELVKQWLKTAKGTPEQKEQEFTKTIIAFNEQAKRDYPKSTLRQIFTELKEGT